MLYKAQTRWMVTIIKLKLYSTREIMCFYLLYSFHWSFSGKLDHLFMLCILYPSYIYIYLRDFSEETGPNHNLPGDSKPIDYFFLFFPVEMFQKITAETNRYAEHKQREREDRLWSRSCVEEIRTFFFSKYTDRHSEDA